MNKVDSFFVLIMVLLSGLTLVYNSAQYDLGDKRLQHAENHHLKNKIKLLELKQKDLEVRLSIVQPQGKRNIASESGPELNPEKLAENLYTEVVEQCTNRKKDLLCIDKIESVVGQFPQSKWAGKSLVVLTNRYIMEKRYEQATDLVKIVRAEFKNEAEVMRQLKEIEKNQL